MFNNNKKCTHSIESSTYVLQSEILIIESGLHIQMWGTPPPQIWTWSSTFQGQDNQEFLVFLERLIYNKTITCMQREIHIVLYLSRRKEAVNL